jgi:uncharacterized protein (TIGR00730 family)
MRWCVFCGSQRGRNPAYAQAANAFGMLAAARGVGLVYGGGHVGLMGEVADAALRNGGEVIGVIPRALEAREIAQEGLTELHVVETMHERKALMASLSDAFVVLPGGFGTFDEYCEMLTWAQLGIQEKPIVLVNIDGYFDPFLAMVARMVDDGFVSVKNRELVHVVTDVAAVPDALAERMHPEHLDTARRRPEHR